MVNQVSRENQGEPCRWTMQEKQEMQDYNKTVVKQMKRKNYREPGEAKELSWTRWSERIIVNRVNQQKQEMQDNGQNCG